MNELLRDEILLQIINQLWNNIDFTKLTKAWLLMSNCLSCFSPSAKFYKYLFKYLLRGERSFPSHRWFLVSFPKRIHWILMDVNGNYRRQVQRMHRELIHRHNWNGQPINVRLRWHFQPNSPIVSLLVFRFFFDLFLFSYQMWKCMAKLNHGWQANNTPMK